MITKDRFIKLIIDNEKYNDNLCKLEEALGSSLDGELFEYANFLFNDFLEFAFTDEAVDDIYWWLYEKNGNPTMKMWDKNGDEIPTETIDDLWEIIKDDRK